MPIYNTNPQKEEILYFLLYIYTFCDILDVTKGGLESLFIDSTDIEDDITQAEKGIFRISSGACSGVTHISWKKGGCGNECCS